MDLASLIGIVGGIVLLIFGIVIGDSGVNFGLMENFVDFNSVLITIGGTLTSTITSNSIQDFVNGFKSIRLIFKTPVLNVRSSIRQIIELSRQIVEKYNGKVPDSIEELCKFNGVGRKTANLVMTLGFGVPAICVDVHVHRIFNRLGYIKTSTPEETEFALRKKLPVEYWIPINTLLVTHGQNVCRPINPKCSECPVFAYCDKLI